MIPIHAVDIPTNERRAEGVGATGKALVVALAFEAIKAERPARPAKADEEDSQCSPF